MKQLLPIFLFIFCGCQSVQEYCINNALIKKISIEKNRTIGIEDLPSDKSFKLIGMVKVKGGKGRNARIICDGGSFNIHYDRFNSLDGAKIEIEGICHIMREILKPGNSALVMPALFATRPFKGLDIKNYKVLLPPPIKKEEPEEKDKGIILK
jgi:hypothetical protein